MSDLISRASLLKELDPYCNPYIDAYGRGYVAGISTAISHIEEAPAVQPEVRRGMWIKLDRAEHRMKPVDIYECSECGAWSDEKCAKNFCPNCGADMREVEP